MAEEKNFENKIKKFIEDRGGWQVKFFANQMTRSGIPDLLCCIDGYFVAIEVKAQHGKPSELQIHHCNKIRKAGGFAFIVYPSGWETLKSFIGGLRYEEFNRDMPLIIK